MSDPNPSPLHFARFEFKYRLDAAARRAIAATLATFVEIEPFAARRASGSYLVRSLYFDDPRFTAFHAKADGLLRRSRFRLRTYGRAPGDGAPWFLEQKGREGALVWKHRTPVHGPFDASLRGDALVRVLLQKAAPGPVRDRFEAAVFRQRIRPCVLVDYHRSAYATRFDPDFRLTFDTEMAAAASDMLHPDPAWPLRAFLRGATVMEVKVRRRLPAWFHRVVQTFELRREPISKVDIATRMLGLAAD